MDFFKFNSETGMTDPTSGAAINGATRKMWVERYSEPGEFEIIAPVQSDLRRFLPLGTLISHINTSEVMMVENQEITENLGENSELKITGRSFVAYLENRLIGVNAARSNSIIVPITLASAITWNQVVTLINQYISTPTTDPNDRVPDVLAVTDLTGVGTTEARPVEGDVLKAVLDILGVDDLGIKSSAPVGTPFLELRVYKGVDKSRSVIFSWTTNDLNASSYLFTNRKLKTTALVVGKGIWTVVDTPGATGYARRMMRVDSDIDKDQNTPPSGPTLTGLISKMQTAGRQALRKQRELHITNAEVSNLSKYEYRFDYNMGDLVTIEGDYNQQEVKRVTEYAEIEDENGYSGHPTLDSPFDETP
jgi:hypothetical protein